MVLELYLIRHTKPAVVRGICYGQTDLEPAASFQKEFARLSTHLPDTFDRVYSSPLKRCTRLAQRLSKSPIWDDRLMEMDFGTWEMKAWHDIPKEQLEPWMGDFVNVAVPGGESFEQLISRSLSALEEIIEQSASQVAVVSHAGVIRSFLGHFLKMNPQNYFDIQVDYGGVSKVSVEGHYHRIYYINRI